MTTQTITEKPRIPLYLRLWQGVPRELLFLLLTLPIAVTGFGVTVGLFSSGIGTVVTFFIGVFLFIASLYVSRGFGALELARLRLARMPAIERPVWQQSAPGFWGWLRSMFSNGHYWLYLAHTMIVNFIVSLISWTITVTWVATALGGLSYWFWQRFIPVTEEQSNLSHWLFGAAVGDRGAEIVVQLVLGVILLATLPFITRGLTLAHWGVARGLLAAFPSDALRQQVGDLTRARGAAAAAEGHSLRKLERDIHDGPQQRLVRLQMDLAAAERSLDSDVAASRDLIASATEQAREALEELRALSRGFAPPILLDRGLVAALRSAADRSVIAATVVDEVGSVELPLEVERNAYFVASEALANAAKHSGATAIDVRATIADAVLTVTVSDNGSGGAALVDGHGLAGLDERVRGLGGTLTIESPANGGTTVVASIPVAETA
jgi:signal transduction histidine kinase